MVGQGRAPVPPWYVCSKDIVRSTLDNVYPKHLQHCHVLMSIFRMVLCLSNPQCRITVLHGSLPLVSQICLTAMTCHLRDLHSVMHSVMHVNNTNHAIANSMQVSHKTVFTYILRQKHHCIILHSQTRELHCFSWSRALGRRWEKLQHVSSSLFSVVPWRNLRPPCIFRHAPGVAPSPSPTRPLAHPAKAAG